MVLVNALGDSGIGVEGIGDGLGVTFFCRFDPPNQCNRRYRGVVGSRLSE
jgi:hypothetical protein